MDRITTLSKAPGIMAIVQIPDKGHWDASTLKETLFFMLDGLNDPGNLGTIIRIADWFGIQYVFCSVDTVDLYNPKVVQATMGSLFRVNVVTTDLENLVDVSLSDGVSIYAAVMEGQPVRRGMITHGGIILGSESHGIRQPLLKSGVQKITIPSFGKAESLNVAVAGGILAAMVRL